MNANPIGCALNLLNLANYLKWSIISFSFHVDKVCLASYKFCCVLIPAVRPLQEEHTSTSISNTLHQSIVLA